MDIHNHKISRDNICLLAKMVLLALRTIQSKGTSLDNLGHTKQRVLSALFMELSFYKDLRETRVKATF